MKYFKYIFINLFLITQIFFQEVENLDVYYTLFAGITVLDIFIVIFLFLGLIILKINSFNIIYLSSVFVFILIGFLFGNFNIIDKFKDAHYFIYSTIGLIVIFNIDKESMVKSGIFFIHLTSIYILLFLGVYIFKREIVTEYGFRVVSRFDIVLPFLYVLTTKLTNSKKYSILIQVLLLTKILLSISRGLVIIFIIVLLFDLIFSRKSSFANFIPPLIVVFIAFQIPQIDEFKSSFSERFMELYSDESFSVNNTASFNAKMDDTQLMKDRISLYPNGFGSTISPANTTKSENSFYSDNLFYTILFKFGLIFGVLYLLFFFFSLYKMIGIKYIFYFILLSYSNVSLMYWRSSLLIFFSIFIISYLNNSKNEIKSFASS